MQANQAWKTYNVQTGTSLERATPGLQEMTRVDFER